MTDFIFYFYIGLLFLGIFSIVYQIYKYGIIGHLERRAERRKKRQDRLINIIHDTF